MSSDGDFFASSESEDYIPEDDYERPTKTRAESRRAENAAVRSNTFKVVAKHKLLRINGMSRASNGEYVFNVEIMNVMGPVFVAHRDMKKYFIQELIVWYEKYLTIGQRPMNIGTYDPNALKSIPV